MSILNFFKKKKDINRYGLFSDDMQKHNDVQKLIDSDIRHFVRSHNGRIRLLAVKENIIYIEMSGSCSNCPAITITMNGFIKKIFRDNFPWYVDTINY